MPRLRAWLGLMKFSQNLAMMLREVAYHPRIANYLAEVTNRHNKIEMVGAVGLLGDPKLTLQIDGFEGLCLHV